jgi:hypothetical protein
MSYTIKKFYETTGQILVKFDSGPSQFAIDIPLTTDDLYIVGTELDEYIKAFEPKDFNSRGQKVANGIANSADIAALVVASPDEEPTPEQLAAAEAAKAAELEKYIKATLVKYNLIAG